MTIGLKRAGGEQISKFKFQISNLLAYSARRTLPALQSRHETSLPRVAERRDRALVAALRRDGDSLGAEPAGDGVGPDRRPDGDLGSRRIRGLVPELYPRD